MYYAKVLPAAKGSDQSGISVCGGRSPNSQSSSAALNGLHLIEHYVAPASLSRLVISTSGKQQRRAVRQNLSIGQQHLQAGPPESATSQRSTLVVAECSADVTFAISIKENVGLEAGQLSVNGIYESSPPSSTAATTQLPIPQDADQQPNIQGPADQPSLGLSVDQTLSTSQVAVTTEGCQCLQSISF